MNFNFLLFNRLKKMLEIYWQKPRDFYVLRSSYSISKSSCILGEFFKKKTKTKNPHPTEILSTSSSILVFYPGSAARHLCLALSASHFFLDFAKTIGFHHFFASYFVLHNSYIRILAIHKYKSFWRYSEWFSFAVPLQRCQQVLRQVYIF